MQDLIVSWLCSITDKNSQNVPANDQHPRKIPKTSIGTSTADAASIAEQVPIKRPSTTNSNVQYQAAISDELDPSKQRVSSSNTISIEQRESESGSSPKAQLEDELGGSMAGIRVRDLRSMQSWDLTYSKHFIGAKPHILWVCCVFSIHIGMWTSEVLLFGRRIVFFTVESV